MFEYIAKNGRVMHTANPVYAMVMNQKAKARAKVRRETQSDLVITLGQMLTNKAYLAKQ